MAAYEIFRNGAAIGTSSTATYTDTTVTAATTYLYWVSALDGAGNFSPASATITVKTP